MSTHDTSAFEIVPITHENRDVFFRLLEEQADILEPESAPSRLCDTTRESLFRHVTQTDQCKAFMVHDHAVGAPVTAVTYFDCWTPYGTGLYLEDIITSGNHRRRGHGAFALSALAQIAVESGFDSLRWECAATNSGAQSFYDRLGSHRMEGRQTWRNIQGISAENSGSALHPVTQPRDALSFGLAAAQATGPAICLDGLYGPHRTCLAAAQYYRSYSTFRACAGLHVEALAVPDRNADHARSFLGALWAQRGASWGGHFDITVPESQSWLKPVLSDMGFAPLAYGQGVMVPRVLHGQAVHNLAASVSRPLGPARPSYQMATFA